MDIVFSINNNAEIMVLPVSPEWEMAEDQGNETYNGLSFNIRMIGNPGLRTMELSSFLPSKRYPFVNPYADINPQAYIDFFRRIKSDKIPARIVITDRQSVERLNMAVSIDNFTYQYRANGDADFSLSMTEYFFL
ncbi:hypothetical protein [Anaerotignum sp. MSJ-24]|uniref:hypothetical protein n=1 Tax=Anaerotignum sp. MSJ-24 TaxID=2841521 RepID=UPI001C119FD6|nr:hypothetical protein [Anaerotignum sp. MSJ-24]MBU5464973.1 hypothetical protein [Anaerotignum sp. MSJ-24]